MHCPQASHRVRTVPPTTVEAMDTTTLFPPASATPTATAPPSPTTPAGATGEPGRFSRLWRGPESDPSWGRPGLMGLLAATAVLLFWGLTASGWSNAFYSAAVQAGSASWKAFFFGSSDAASSITVDKPPASLWVMALSVRALGLSSFSILMPEVRMGVASVAVLHATVKRQFGAAAGLLAGAVLALTPVAVMMFRFDNPDALLVLLMALGAYATLRAIEQASPRWLIWVGVFIGFCFLTKMLQALVVVPAFALAYLVAAPTPLRKRILHLLAAGAAMVVSAGWWIALVELVPPSARPHIRGGTRQTHPHAPPRPGPTSAGHKATRSSSSPSATTGWAGSPATRSAQSAVAVDPPARPVACGEPRGGPGCSTPRSAARSRGSSRVR